MGGGKAGRSGKLKTRTPSVSIFSEESAAVGEVSQVSSSSSVAVAVAAVAAPAVALKAAGHVEDIEHIHGGAYYHDDEAGEAEVDFDVEGVLGAICAMTEGGGAGGREAREKLECLHAHAALALDQSGGDSGDDGGFDGFGDIGGFDCF